MNLRCFVSRGGCMIFKTESCHGSRQHKKKQGHYLSSWLSRNSDYLIVIYPQEWQHKEKFSNHEIVIVNPAPHQGLSRTKLARDLDTQLLLLAPRVRLAGPPPLGCPPGLRDSLADRRRRSRPMHLGQVIIWPRPHQPKERNVRCD